VDRHAISEKLAHIARLLALKGENPFKVRAFENGAEIVAGLPDLESLLAQKKLETTPGIGKAIAAVVTELAATGQTATLESLEKEVPSTLPELLRVPGLGVKKATALWKELGITSLGELEYAIRENRLAALPGFGARTQEKFASGIQLVRSGSGRWRLPEAMKRLDEAKALLLSPAARDAGISRVEIAGELRRGMETVDGLVLVVACVAPEKLPLLAEVPGVPPVTVDAGPEANFGNRLLQRTGSERHIDLLRARDGNGGLRIPSFEEKDLYERLGLPHIPPELREGNDEVERAANGTLPRLVEQADLRGLFHVHSTYSDGRATLEENFRRIAELGYSYVGITDHSPSAAYARGLTPARVHEQWKEIDRLRPRFPGLTIFRGTEADILADGSIDYGDEFLAGFDFVIASVHSAFHLPRREQTARLVRAVRNPRVTLLGHATGRLLLSRRGIDVDLPAVLAAAGTAGTGVEINASPYRMELDWRLGAEARAAGVFTSIDPDAHALHELDDVVWGIRVARKAGFSPEAVLNTLPADRVAARLAAARARA
jgi:DNA polymerase (family X)